AEPGMLLTPKVMHSMVNSADGGTEVLFVTDHVGSQLQRVPTSTMVTSNSLVMGKAESGLDTAGFHGTRAHRRDLLIRASSEKGPARSPYRRKSAYDSAMSESDKGAALRSVSSPSFAQVLTELQCSLIVTTYQAGKVILVRADEG